MNLVKFKETIHKDSVRDIDVMKAEGGWMICILNGSKERTTKEDCCLYRARGGLRVFKTLDAIKALFRSEEIMCKMVVH